VRQRTARICTQEVSIRLSARFRRQCRSGARRAQDMWMLAHRRFAPLSPPPRTALCCDKHGTAQRQPRPPPTHSLHVSRRQVWRLQVASARGPLLLLRRERICADMGETQPFGGSSLKPPTQSELARTCSAAVGVEVCAGWEVGARSLAVVHRVRSHPLATCAPHACAPSVERFNDAAASMGTRPHRTHQQCAAAPTAIALHRRDRARPRLSLQQPHRVR